jgi:glyoxylase-like metal-dependent hydrolase (beta-lactamase superfamily II)
VKGRASQEGRSNVQSVPPDEAARFPAQDGPEQVEAGVWRIPVPLPFALRSANTYLVDDGPGQRTLIDSGLGLSADEQALRDGLARAGIALADISALVLTHAHPDHIGLSGLVHGEANAPVYLLAGEDRQIFEVWGAGGAAILPRLDEMYRANGLPDELRADSQKSGLALRRILRLPPTEAIRALHDEQQIELGAHRYTVVWTPGHSDHHLCLLRDDGIFFAGDHILPGITPNIGLYVGARPNPLADYFASLERVRGLPGRLVLPGHGRPFAGLAERADELRDHHRERSGLIHAILAERPDGLSAYAIAGRLFGERLRSVDDWRFAMAETLAHLEFLRSEGRALRARRAGLVRYSVRSLSTNEHAQIAHQKVPPVA